MFNKLSWFIIAIIFAGALGMSTYYYVQYQKVAADTSVKPGETSVKAGIDYNNGQEASATLKGLLTSADWTKFNNKQDALVFNINDFIVSNNNIRIDYSNGQRASAQSKGFLTANDWINFNSKITGSDLSNTTPGLAYSSATGITSLTTGYVIPTTAQRNNWDTAYSWGHWSGQGFITLADIPSDSTGLKLDQTIPQTILNGIPLLGSNRTIDANQQLVDKEYVDTTAVAKTGDTMSGALIVPEFFVEQQLIYGFPAVKMFEVTYFNTEANGNFRVSGTNGIAPTDFAGTQNLAWIASRAALRAGVVDGDKWDESNLGAFSVAFGDEVLASGQLGQTHGFNIRNTGDYAFAFGKNFDNATNNSFNVGFDALDLKITSGLADFQDSNIFTTGLIGDGGNNALYVSDIANKNGNNIFTGTNTFPSITVDTDTLFVDPVNHGVGIGTTAPNANALLDITSTTKAFMPPRMTTVQRDAIPSPTAGMMIYNVTTNKLNIYTTAWEAVTSVP